MSEMSAGKPQPEATPLNIQVRGDIPVTLTLSPTRNFRLVINSTVKHLSDCALTRGLRRFQFFLWKMVVFPEASMSLTGPILSR
jgi:hypothetical protein